MKLRKLIALLSVCVLLCSVLPTVSAADLHPLKNGDFETGDLTHWSAADSVTVSADAAYKGDYGCLITGNGGWSDLLSQTFSVLPDYTYTLSFWYKAQPMGVSFYLFDGEDNERLYRGWAGETTWTKVVTEFTPSTDTVTLLFRSSGSHVAELVYLDCVEVTLNPCDTHTYDNACDTTCNVCEEVRTVGDHLYDSDCDAYCNHCGFERNASGKHVYNYACAALCAYCGAPRISEEEHTYDDVCDSVCNVCTEVRKVPHFYEYPCAAECTHCGDVRVEIAEELHTYDDIYDADCSYCDHVRIPAPKPMERLSYGGAAFSPDVNGVAFRFYLEATGATMKIDQSYVTKSALVERYNNGVGYQLIRVGAVMSNKKGVTLDLESVDGSKVINVHAGYLCEVTEDSIAFAVRIINIPTQGWNTNIYARPYYIYSDGKEEVVVYGETFYQTYNNLANGY